MLRQYHTFLVVLLLSLLGSTVQSAASATKTGLDWPALAVQHPEAALLLDIVAVGTARILAVGERGIITFSDDAGAHWQQADVPSYATLTSVTFVDAQTGWAVGHDAVILNTTDGGAHWQKQHFAPDLQQPLLDVLFLSKQTGFAVGAYGLFLFTEDGGQHWQDVYLDTLEDPEFGLPHFNTLIQQQSTLYLAGEAGLFAFSVDQGKTWQRIKTQYQGSYFDMLAVPKGILLNGLRGRVFHVTQATAMDDFHFQSLATPIQQTIVDSYTTQSSLYLLSNKGQVLMSPDVSQPFQTLDWHYQGAAAALLSFEQALYVVGDKGVQVMRSQP